MATPMVGVVYTTVEGLTGYFMVMAKQGDQVIISPLFWDADDYIRLQGMPRDYFEKSYKRFNEATTHNLPATLQGRYDREKIRRWQVIQETRRGED